MKRNIFIQESKLHSVRGRITYISSTAKQENLYAVYETTDRSYWSRLAIENQKDFKRSGTKGRCIEARELIIALPEELQEYDPNEVLRDYTEAFKEKYGVECISALHHNKKKTNYHIHLIFSERSILKDPQEKIASRNMYYDENGKKVRTKKEVTGSDGNLRKGCKVIKKGEVYEANYFERKNQYFKTKSFLKEVKELYSSKMNRTLESKGIGYRMQVFDKSSPYLPLKKIGKNNKNEKYIRANNNLRLKWNSKISKFISMGVPFQLLIEVKRLEVTEPIKLAIKEGNTVTDKIASILSRAVLTLSRFVSTLARHQLLDKVDPKSNQFAEALSLCRVSKEKTDRQISRY